MKHQYEDKDIQAAIDAACQKEAMLPPIAECIYLTENGKPWWGLQKDKRRHILKTALNLLPEPPPPVVDGKTPGQVAFEVTAAPGYFWPLTPEAVKKQWESTASAVLAAFGNKQQPTGQHGPAGMPPLRGPGLVLEPVESKPEVIHDGGEVFEVNSAKEIWDAAMPEPSTFESHGKVWTRHTPGDPMPCERHRMVHRIYEDDQEEKQWLDNYCTRASNIMWSGVVAWRYADEPTPEPEQPWTPKVGDVVTLKSGGPKMTITALNANKDNAGVSWFNEGVINSASFDTSTIIPA